MSGIPSPIHTEPGRFIDSAHPRVREFVAAWAGDGNDRERAVNLYYAVRDQFYYDPYKFSASPEDLKASALFATDSGYCVPKAVALAAAGRAAGVPSRIGFADVRNHLASERLLQVMGTDLFRYHGYTEFFIDGQWVKATPAFNIELCERFGVKPLEFDGRSDSVMHEFDQSGQRHMEYLVDHGPRDDVPIEELQAVYRKYYGHMLDMAETVPAAERGDMAAEMEAEAARSKPQDA